MYKKKFIMYMHII